jgi:hypothetical protein
MNVTKAGYMWRSNDGRKRLLNSSSLEKLLSRACPHVSRGAFETFRGATMLEGRSDGEMKCSLGFAFFR